MAKKQTKKKQVKDLPKSQKTKIDVKKTVDESSGFLADCLAGKKSSAKLSPPIQFKIEVEDKPEVVLDELTKTLQPFGNRDFSRNKITAESSITDVDQKFGSIAFKLSSRIDAIDGGLINLRQRFDGAISQLNKKYEADHASSVATYRKLEAQLSDIKKSEYGQGGLITKSGQKITSGGGGFSGSDLAALALLVFPHIKKNYLDPFFSKYEKEIGDITNSISDNRAEIQAARKAARMTSGAITAGRTVAKGVGAAVKAVTPTRTPVAPNVPAGQPTTYGGKASGRPLSGVPRPASMPTAASKPKLKKVPLEAIINNKLTRSAFGILLKKLPIIGLGAAMIDAGVRIGRGDGQGAALAAGSGIAGLLPGFGTVTSFAADLTLIAHDIFKEAHGRHPDLTDPEDIKEMGRIYEHIGKTRKFNEAYIKNEISKANNQALRQSGERTFMAAMAKTGQMRRGQYTGMEMDEQIASTTQGGYLFGMIGGKRVPGKTVTLDQNRQVPAYDMNMSRMNLGGKGVPGTAAGSSNYMAQSAGSAGIITPSLPMQRQMAMMPPLPSMRPQQPSFASNAYRERVYQQKSQFMQFGALPGGFENVMGNRGILGKPMMVAASGAQPFGGGFSGGGYSGGGYSGGGYSGGGYSGGNGGSSAPSGVPGGSSAPSGSANRMKMPSLDNSGEKGPFNVSHLDKEVRETPGLWDHIIKLGAKEQGGGSVKSITRVYETIRNRAIMRGTTISNITDFNKRHLWGTNSSKLYWAPLRKNSPGRWDAYQPSESVVKKLEKAYHNAYVRGTNAAAGATHAEYQGTFKKNPTAFDRSIERSFVPKNFHEDVIYQKTHEKNVHNKLAKYLRPGQSAQLLGGRTIRSDKPKPTPAATTPAATRSSATTPAATRSSATSGMYGVSAGSTTPPLPGRKPRQSRSGGFAPFGGMDLFMDTDKLKYNDEDRAGHLERGLERNAADKIVKHLNKQTGDGAHIARIAMEAYGLEEYGKEREWLKEFFKKGRVEHDPKGDKNAWCAQFVKSVAQQSGVKLDKDVNWAIATNWTKAGQAVNNPAGIKAGDIAIKHRGLEVGQGGGIKHTIDGKEKKLYGHVAIFTGRTKKRNGKLYYETISGNLKDRVDSSWEIVDFSKSGTPGSNAITAVRRMKIPSGAIPALDARALQSTAALQDVVNKYKDTNVAGKKGEFDAAKLLSEEDAIFRKSGAESIGAMVEGDEAREMHLRKIAIQQSPEGAITKLTGMGYLRGPNTLTKQDVLSANMRRARHIPGQVRFEGSQELGSFRAATGGRTYSMPYGYHKASSVMGSGPKLSRKFYGMSSSMDLGRGRGRGANVVGIGGAAGRMYDPRLRRMRTEIQAHPAIGGAGLNEQGLKKLISSGCLAIQPNQYKNFIAAYRQYYKENNGKVWLKFMPAPEGQPHEFVFTNKPPGKEFSVGQAIANWKRSGDIDPSTATLRQQAVERMSTQEQKEYIRTRNMIPQKSTMVSKFDPSNKTSSMDDIPKSVQDMRIKTADGRTTTLGELGVTKYSELHKKGGQAFAGGRFGTYNDPNVTFLGGEIQRILGPKFNRITAQNDKFHHGEYATSYKSQHLKGTKLDFTLKGDYRTSVNRLTKQLKEELGLIEGKHYKINRNYDHGKGRHVDLGVTPAGIAILEQIRQERNIGSIEGVLNDSTPDNVIAEEASMLEAATIASHDSFALTTAQGFVGPTAAADALNVIRAQEAATKSDMITGATGPESMAVTSLPTGGVGAELDIGASGPTKVVQPSSSSPLDIGAKPVSVPTPPPPSNDAKSAITAMADVEDKIQTKEVATKEAKKEDTENTKKRTNNNRSRSRSAGGKSGSGQHHPEQEAPRAGSSGYGASGRCWV